MNSEILAKTHPCPACDDGELACVAKLSQQAPPYLHKCSDCTHSDQLDERWPKIMLRPDRLSAEDRKKYLLACLPA